MKALKENESHQYINPREKKKTNKSSEILTYDDKVEYCTRIARELSVNNPKREFRIFKEAWKTCKWKLQVAKIPAFPKVTFKQNKMRERERERKKNVHLRAHHENSPDGKRFSKVAKWP